jgi:hypothetical protein
VCRSKSTLTDLRTSLLAFAAAQCRARSPVQSFNPATFDRQKDGQRDTARAISSRCVEFGGGHQVHLWMDRWTKNMSKNIF